MNQGIGVEHLHAAAEVQRLLHGAAGGFAEFHGQNGADSLPPCQQAVPHGLLQSAAGEKFPKAPFRQRL